MKCRRIWTGVGISLIALTLFYFLFRNTVLHWSFTKAQTHSLQNYGLLLSTADLHFSGFDRILFNHLVLQPDSGDTLLHIHQLECNVSITNLLTLKIGFDAIRVNGAVATIYNETDRDNFHFLPKAKTSTRRETISSANNFYEKANGFKAKFFSALKTSFFLKDIYISYADSTLSEDIFLVYAEYDRKKLSALLINQKSGDSTEMTGVVLKKNKSYQFLMQHFGKENAYLPFLDREQGLQCRFKSVSATIVLNDTREELQITTDLEAKNFEINHWRIAKEDVVFPFTHFKGMWHIRNDAMELDSTSSFTLGQIPVQLFANYSTAPDTGFTLNLRMPETVSDTFFRALPQQMFSTLKGISCSGTLSYQLQFIIYTQQPDSLTFNSSLTRKNFRLNNYGAVNYARINEPFVYDAYDKDRLVRQITIGHENPYFTPLDKISHYLTKSVLQSEDPSFMQHHGFLPEAFRESMAKNFKEKRFARGGSTISMQLVKNVFLNRDKTIARKAEEVLIVYLIENLGLVSKERMLEIYLNVIEWGPNVYGIGEASRFYFSKKPSELSLQESIFLASIIPAPKYFKYRFDKEGNLRPSIEGYFHTLTNRMAGKGWLTTADTTGLLPQIKLKGHARNLILPADSMIEEAEEDF